MKDENGYEVVESEIASYIVLDVMTKCPHCGCNNVLTSVDCKVYDKEIICKNCNRIYKTSWCLY